LANKIAKLEDLKPVLIAGAGPTGMMAAIELSRFNIPVRLIEKKAEPDTTSRAIGVQARTLELLEQRGIGSSLVKHGNPGLAFSLYGEGSAFGASTTKPSAASTTICSLSLKPRLRTYYERPSARLVSRSSEI
jgi:2-polyprenyl-6-methoxyphenol hydroxylase-like FAD-dependent oxidoreductase